MSMMLGRCGAEEMVLLESASRKAAIDVVRNEQTLHENGYSAETMNRA
jgi:hypothetical protein